MRSARWLLGTAHGAAGLVGEAVAGPLGALAGSVAGPLGAAVGTAGVLREARLITPIRPDRLVGMALALRYGTSIAAGLSVAAARDPRHVGLIDDEGSLTYRELAERSDALAESYALRGVQSGTAVGLLARNGRGFLEPLVALSKVGADVVLLNTGMAAPQLAEVTRRETLVAAVSDADLADLLPAVCCGSTRRCTASAGSRPARRLPLPAGSCCSPRGRPGPPRARRAASGVPGRASRCWEAIPYRAGEPLLIASPMFPRLGPGQPGALAAARFDAGRPSPFRSRAGARRHRGARGDGDGRRTRHGAAAGRARPGHPRRARQHVVACRRHLGARRCRPRSPSGSRTPTATSSTTSTARPR